MGEREGGKAGCRLHLVSMGEGIYMFFKYPSIEFTGTRRSNCRKAWNTLRQAVWDYYTQVQILLLQAPSLRVSPLSRLIDRR
jgi:hypothetical protein